MAVTTVLNLTETLDTQLSVALDVYSGQPTQLVHDSGEKFLNHLRSAGRIFGIQDTEKIRHPHLIGGAGVADHGTTSYYAPDLMSGAPSDNNLGQTAEEMLTWSQYYLAAATRNINMPQSMPKGNIVDYVRTVAAANASHIFNEEEKLFWLGTGGTTSVPVGTGPGQMDATPGTAAYPTTPMSAYALFTFGTNAFGSAGNDNFADLDAVANQTRWAPTVKAGVTLTNLGLISALQSAILESDYGAMERPDTLFVTLQTFEALLVYLRSKGALPDPVQANVGKEGTVPFGGLTVDWSRNLGEAVKWDSANTAAETPILGFNMKSMRLNLVLNSSPIDGKLGFIEQLGPVLPHPAHSNLFKRIAWKRQYSLDKGRRSFFIVHGYNHTNILA